MHAHGVLYTCELTAFTQGVLTGKTKSSAASTDPQACLLQGYAHWTKTGWRQFPALALHSKQPYGNQPSAGALSRLQDTVCMAEQITLLLVRDCAIR